MEVSSHALVLDRVDGMPLRRGGLHEPDARPPRLPRRHGELLRREAPALRPAQARRRRRRQRRTTRTAGGSLARRPPRRELLAAGDARGRPRGAARCDLSGHAPSTCVHAGGAASRLRLAAARALQGRQPARRRGRGARASASTGRGRRRAVAGVANVPGRLERVEAGRPTRSSSTTRTRRTRSSGCSPRSAS